MLRPLYLISEGRKVKNPNLREVKMKDSSDPVVSELKRITKLLALSIVRTEPSLREQIKLLHQLEFTNKEISDMLRIPEGTVSSNLARAKQPKTKEI